MISSGFRPLFRPFVESTVVIFEKLGISPNALTVIGFLILIAAFWMFLFVDRTVGILLFLLSVVFDIFDGALARKTKKVTKFGEYLDANIDKVVEILIFFCFGVYSWPLAFLAGTTSILVSYSKHRADRLGIRIDCGLFERFERLLFVLFGALASEYMRNPTFMTYILLISTVLSSVTILQRWLKAYQLLR